MRLKLALWLLRPILKSRNTRITLHKEMRKFYENTYYEDNSYSHLYNNASELFDAHDVSKLDLGAITRGIGAELDEVHKGVNFKVDIPVDSSNRNFKEAREIIEREHEMAAKTEKQEKFKM